MTPILSCGHMESVLLVEDDECIRLVLKMSLNRLGIEAEVATDGGEALQCCLRRQYDLILMDIDLPIMNGFALTGAIRTNELESKLKPVPIVGMTAGVSTKEQALAAGMNDMFLKPIMVDDLKALIETWAPHLQN